MVTRSWTWVLLLSSVLVVALVALVGACSTQAAYPTKAIELTVAFAAGGGGDVTARVAAKYLTADLGVPVNVVNKPGGNQIPAVLSVMGAPADGYTLLYETGGNSSMHGIVKDLPYKLEDRTYMDMMIEGPQAFVVNGKSPWKTLQDVADAGKKDPSSITWGRLGGSSVTDFVQLQFFDAAGIDISKTKPVAFDGSGPAITAVAGGHVAFGSAGTGAVLPLVASGDLRILGVSGDRRLSVAKDAPSAKEAGFPTVDLLAWFGLSGPKGLPQNVIDKLDKSAKKITEDPAFAKDLEAVGFQPRYIGPGQFHDYIFKEIDKFKALSAKGPQTK